MLFIYRKVVVNGFLGISAIAITLQFYTMNVMATKYCHSAKNYTRDAMGSCLKWKLDDFLSKGEK